MCPCCSTCALRMAFSVFSLFVSSVGASSPFLVGALVGLMRRDLASQKSSLTADLEMSARESALLWMIFR